MSAQDRSAPSKDPLAIDARILLGPGPSDVHPRVIRAMATPVVGHLDPQYLALMDRVQEQLREVFRTRNEMTLFLPGTGMSGMECALVNLVEPGDKLVVGVAGVFASRMVDVATRMGADIVPVEASWGQVIDPAAMIATIEKERPKLVGLVHGETSTGILQPVEEIARAAREHGAMTIVDTVASLTGAPFETDAWGVDVVYTGSQKCLSCPPGLAPITFGERAWQAVLDRKAARPSFYLDMLLHAKYWGPERVYHHTAPCSLGYALHEGLNMVLDEGLEARFARHRRHHEALLAGLDAMGLGLVSDPKHRNPVLNAVAVPEGVDGEALRKELLADHSIEVGAGLGPFKGKVWRVGLMGTSASENNVLLFFAALDKRLRAHGFTPKASGAEAAAARYASE